MKKHLRQLAVIVFLVFLAWYKILFQTPKGEGFLFFNPAYLSISFISFDSGARLFFNFFTFLFKDNLQILQICILFFIILLALFFYWFSYETMRNKTIAFISSLFFSVNYVGTYEMQGAGNPTRFTNRAFWFLLLFPSFIFFLKYIKQKKEKYFIFSLLLYTLSVYLAQFSIFFLPMFLTYFMASLFEKKASFKKISTVGLHILLYIIVTVIILILDHYYDKISFIKYGLENQNFFSFLVQHANMIFNQFLHQLSILIFPKQIVLFVCSKGGYVLKDVLSVFRILSILIYLGLAAFLLKKEKKFKTIIVMLLLFIPIILVLNTYVRGDVVGASDLGNWGSRYLYVPMIGMSILWALLINSLISSRKIIERDIGLILIVLFLYTQVTTLWKQMDDDYYTYKEIKTSLAYLKSLSPKISNDSVVIVPSMLGYHGAVFAKVYYHKNQGFFMPFQSSWHKKMKIPFDPGNLYVLQYDPVKRPFDPKKDYILEYDREKEKVVDLTIKYREIFAKRQEEEP